MSLNEDFDLAASLAIEGGNNARKKPAPPPAAAAVPPVKVLPVSAYPVPAGPAKRPAPFSIRLSEADRARLAMEAAGAPLGSYIKEKLLSSVPVERKRRKVLSIQDREALAQALALLGRSNLSNNLNQLAKLAHIGVLPVTPETEAELLAAAQDARAIRRLLLSALGFKPEGDAP